MKISIRKVTGLELIGEPPKDLNGEIEITVKCWITAIEKPIKQNLDDDDSEILKVSVLDGLARLKN